ncbi:MAG: putative diacylglycerol kinase family protein [Myxococcales bacterium]|nr:putative diacylglycerol kinase family protein [Myxococcales bacterium]
MIAMKDLIGKLAKPPVVVGAAVVTAIVQGRKPGEAARFLVGVPLTALATKVIKRLHPEYRPSFCDRKPRQSFPSGHSASVTAYLLSLVDSCSAWWALPLVGAGVAMVNVSRVKNREHWISDVVVGDLVGAVGALAGAIVARVIAKTRRPSTSTDVTASRRNAPPSPFAT